MSDPRLCDGCPYGVECLAHGCGLEIEAKSAEAAATATAGPRSASAEPRSGMREDEALSHKVPGRLQYFLCEDCGRVLSDPHLTHSAPKGKFCDGRTVRAVSSLEAVALEESESS